MSRKPLDNRRAERTFAIPALAQQSGTVAHNCRAACTKSSEYTFMLKKAPCHFWFRICGIFFMLKSLGTLLAPDIPFFYGVQILQMLGWGLIAVSSVYYVNSVMEEQDAIKGQAYITMTYTLGSVIGALLGGALIDAAGVNAMLIFATVSAAVGMVILLFATERTNSSRI